MNYLERDGRFWGIAYIDDANEILLHYGKIGSDGTIRRVYKGYDGDEGLIDERKRLHAKLSAGYKKLSKKSVKKMTLIKVPIKLMEHAR